MMFARRGCEIVSMQGSGSDCRDVGGEEAGIGVLRLILSVSLSFISLLLLYRISFPSEGRISSDKGPRYRPPKALRVSMFREATKSRMLGIVAILVGGPVVWRAVVCVPGRCTPRLRVAAEPKLE